MKPTLKKLRLQKEEIAIFRGGKTNKGKSDTTLGPAPCYPTYADLCEITITTCNSKNCAKSYKCITMDGCFSINQTCNSKTNCGP